MLEVTNTTIDDLKREKSIWLYGIGKTGKKVCSLFEVLEIPIHGILVSDTSNNPVRFNGITVYPTAHCPSVKNALIIMTVQEAAVPHVINTLEKIGCQRYLIWNGQTLRSFWESYPHRFIDRRKGMNKVLFVLSGYKRFLWSHVFGRVISFLPDDVEVCICSSGLFDEGLDKIAENNGWSYLSTERNSVTLIQNIAYSIYGSYTWLYKMDEDIFLTEGSLENLHNAYIKAANIMPYYIGIMAPLIPLNEYGYRFILQKYGCLEDFEKRYGKTHFGGDGKVINTPDIAPYMWGKYETIPTIDKIMTDFDTEEFSVCATRFNIGLILFRKDFWEEMGGFMVSGSKDLGTDEEEICAWCSVYSKAIMVAHEVVVGHFSFGPQEVAMKQYMAESLGTKFYP